MKTLYTAKVTATGGREGTIKSEDGKFSMQLSRPANNQPGTNPEQLFAAGYAGCFGGAVQYLAGQKQLKVDNVAVTADVSLNQNEQGFILSAVLNVALPTLEQQVAEDLVAAAHQFCPYSKATRGNIQVDLVVNGKSIAKAA
ncbi:MAG: organic hydroperoxide resistance protein [Bdellovibrionales bacterium]